MTKVCSKCQKSKDKIQFGYRAKEPDNLSRICKPCFNQKDRIWRANNKQASAAIYKRRENRYRDERLAMRRKIAKEWQIVNKSSVRKNSAKRRVKKLFASPPWISAIQMAQIQEFYDIAIARTMQTGILHHVDHIHPLQGGGFNGLHVPWNLQVLTAEENMKKAAKLPVFDQHLGWSA